MDSNGLSVVTELFAEVDEELSGLVGVESVHLFELPSRANRRSLLGLALVCVGHTGFQ